MRKIEGDVNVLRMDLQAELGLSDKEVVINQLTRQIIVKVCFGHFCFVFTWLDGRGFGFGLCGLGK